MDSLPEGTPHRRRPRYKGKNPRDFDYKYKEHRPELYPETVDKVIASGKTPAGTHRPILLNEVLHVLRLQPKDVVVDATLGYGGHSCAILPFILPGGRLIGIDSDPVELPKTEFRLRQLGFSPEVFIPCHSNFAALPKILAANELHGADVIIADLGLSSMQLDNPARGFSFKSEGSLDLRMNPSKGVPAWQYLANLDQETIIELLIENADEPHARIIAPILVEDRDRNGLRTTTLLAQSVRRALLTLPKALRELEGDAPIRRVFQAIRIEVNEEFQALQAFLRILPTCLNKAGRVAILTFHSGEDRRVKKSFQQQMRAGIYSATNDEVTRPSLEEIRSNPRATSAKLRWAIKS